MSTDVGQALRDACAQTLARVDLRARTAEAMRRETPPSKVVVLALGKSAAPMMSGARDAWGDRIVDAIAARPRRAMPVADVREFVTGHPLPDDESVRAGQAAVAAIQRAATDTEVCVLLSGGASASLCAPRIRIEAYAQCVASWMRAGLPIEAINAGRGRLDTLKNGGLAAVAGTRRVRTFVAVDVIGPDASARDVVGSAPTAHPSIDDALLAMASAAVPAHLRELFDGLPAPAFDDRPRDSFATVARPTDARDAFAAALRAQGFEAHVGADGVGDIDELAAQYRRQLDGLATRHARVSSGEPTVKLPALPGHGGRAGRLALLVARAIAGTRGAFLAAGTDGVDGDSGHAGAVVTGDTALDGAADALERFDDGAWHARKGTAIDVAATGINLLDVHALVRWG